MAKLTKQQELELQKVTEERDIARALSWPNFPKPTPMNRPAKWNEEIRGWAVNSYTRQIREESQDTLYSYRMEAGKRIVSGDQRRDPLYATKREAYLALYHEICLVYGIELAKVLKKAGED